MFIYIIHKFLDTMYELKKRMLKTLSVSFHLSVRKFYSIVIVNHVRCYYIQHGI